MMQAQDAVMRDPQGNLQRYDGKIGEHAQTWQYYDEHFAGMSLARQVGINNYRLVQAVKVLMLRYARGDCIDDIAAGIARDLPVWRSSLDFADRNGKLADKDYTGTWWLDGKWRDSVAFAALALCTLETAQQLEEWSALVAPAPDRRAYLFDLLAASFVPGYRMVNKYKRERHQAPWTDPVLRALALPPERRADALAAHMKKWCRIMKPWGWKPHIDHAYGKDALFDHFAYEVALAVCAYDIDDSSFADHPYYPRELVRWYRTHRRDTRDAWRPVGAGAGIEVVAPPPPARCDLAKSKRKAIARWIELAADGDADAVDSTIETVGRPRKVEDIDELICALYENGHAIHADIKDDETLEMTAGQLLEARGLGDFDGPPGPPFGPARCEALLDALAGWLPERGFVLFRFDSDGDAWCAVLVRAAYADEFRALSDSLRVRIASSA